jgi:hypothetical protein
MVKIKKENSPLIGAHILLERKKIKYLFLGIKKIRVKQKKQCVQNRIVSFA